MKLKNIFFVLMTLVTTQAMAIPPIPPQSIYNKLSAVAARNCVTSDGIKVSELKNTDSVKFILKLNKELTAGELLIVENETIIDSLPVTCR